MALRKPVNWHGLPDLKTLLRPIESLKPDPMNARKHNENNIRVIKNSLETLGQHRPAVVQENNIVTVGNGMIEAAKLLGWTHIACIQAQDDSHSAILRALVDNRSAELAEWEFTELKQLFAEIQDISVIQSIGFDKVFVDYLETTDMQDFQDLLDRNAEKQAAKEKEIECPECGHKFKL